MTSAVLVPLYILLCSVALCLSTQTCEDTLNVVRSFLTDEAYPGGSQHQGYVGLRGKKGPPGPPGEAGVCACDLDAVMSQIRELQNFRNKARRSPGICYVGISTGLVKTSQLSASSIHSSCPIRLGILNSGGAWCAATNNGNQWIQVDFLIARTVNAIVTQGRVPYQQWVTSYHLSYGNTTSEMQYYNELEKVKVFAGNSDATTIVENELTPPIYARYFRIHPVLYRNHMSMRIEMKDC